MKRAAEHARKLTIQSGQLIAKALKVLIAPILTQYRNSGPLLNYAKKIFETLLNTSTQFR
jgi:hypothetical protein